MKKNFKLILALVLSVMMIAGMIPAMAEPTALTEAAIIVNTDKTGHTYKAYQIFTGTLSTDKTKLSDLQWGNGVNDAYKAANTDPNAIADTLSTPADAKAYAETLKSGSYLQNGVALTAISGDGVSYNGTTYTDGYYLSGLTKGYYIVVDETVLNEGEDDFTSDFIVELLDIVVATPKGSTTTVEKKTADVTQDTIPAYDSNDWQDTAVYNVGDIAPFMLDATLADNVSSYKTYTFTYHDTLSEGLTYQADSWSMTFLGQTFNKDNTSATVNGNTVSVTAGSLANYSGTDPDYSNGHVMTWTVTITGPVVETVQQKIAAGSGDTAVDGAHAVITYKALLNGAAEIVSESNPNEVYVTYSNNPNGDGTGKTTEDEVYVFTFKVDNNKWAGPGTELTDAEAEAIIAVPAVAADPEHNIEGKEAVTLKDYTGGSIVLGNNYYVKTSGKWYKYDALAGAGFTLYKGSKASGNEVALIFDSTKNAYRPFTSEDATAGSTSVTEMTSATTTGAFNIVGLDEGTYVLVETTTPDSYNTVPDTTIILTKTTSGTTVTLNTSTSQNYDNELIDNQGTTLPSTGGIGTTIFYIAGSILVLAAAILLITKRRMSNND